MASVGPHDDELGIDVLRFLKNQLVHLPARIAARGAVRYHALRPSPFGRRGQETFARDAPVLDELVRRRVDGRRSAEHAGVGDMEHMKR